MCTTLMNFALWSIDSQQSDIGHYALARSLITSWKRRTTFQTGVVQESPWNKKEKQ